MESILVSIIVPVYNAQKYIERCLNSLINQSYKNIEILLINDGSTDNTLEIIKGYKDKRIKVINKKNGGASASRNYGLDKCNGQYILFVDADDYVSFNMVEVMAKEIYDKDNTVVFANNDEIYKDTVEQRRLFTDIRGDLNKNTVMREIASGKAGLICCKLIPKSVINKFNIRFDESIKMNEDQLFFLEISQYIDKYVYINECVYYYDRTNEKSITAYYQENMYKDQIYVIKKIEQIFSKNNLSSEEDNKAIAKRIKGSLIFCINNEAISTNNKKLKDSIKNIKLILNQANIESKYINYISDSRLGILISKGISSDRNTINALKLFISFKVLIPFKNKINNKMRKYNAKN